MIWFLQSLLEKNSDTLEKWIGFVAVQVVNNFYLHSTKTFQKVKSVRLISTGKLLCISTGKNLTDSTCNIIIGGFESNLVSDNKLLQCRNQWNYSTSSLFWNPLSFQLPASYKCFWSISLSFSQGEIWVMCQSSHVNHIHSCCWKYFP